MLAFSLASTTQLLLPATNDNTSWLHLVAYIRDSYDCVAEYQMASVLVEPDLTEMNDLIKNIQNSTENVFARLLVRDNQNTVSQVITSVSQHLNKRYDQTVRTAVSSMFILYSRSIYHRF